jgi:hypothetical protein
MMRTLMYKIIFSVLLFLQQSLVLYAVDADEIMQIHKVTTTEMNSISQPQVGSLVFNTTEDTLYFYTGIVWKRMRADGSETIVQAGNGVTLSGNGKSVSPYSIGVN